MPLRFSTVALLTLLAAAPDPYRVVEMGNGIFALVRQTPTTGASDSNVLVIVNAHDVVVVDANIYPSSARQTIAEIRKRTANPVRFVINTHAHSDHHYGNGEFAKAYPGVEFISHPAARRSIIDEDIPSLRRNVDSVYPATIGRFERALAAGRRADGELLTPAMRAQYADALTMYRFFLQDVRTMRQQPATITVADSLVLHRGSRDIVVRWIGRGNTDGDLVVHLPRERIVATGDLVVSPIPFGFGSYAGDWPATLRRLARLDVAHILPGHGEVMTGWTHALDVAEAADSVWAGVGRAVRAGASLDSAGRSVQWGPARSRITAGDSARERQFERLFAVPLVESAFRQRSAGGTAGADSLRRQ